MPVFRVSKDDGDDLGFALSCLFAKAITRAEFTAWVYWVIEHAEHDLPAFLFELDDFGPYLKDIYAAVGFVPSSDVTDAERGALEAIGLRRGLAAPTAESIHAGERLSPDRAEVCLAENPHIDARFRSAFPFLQPV